MASSASGQAQGKQPAAFETLSGADVVALVLESSKRSHFETLQLDEAIVPTSEVRSRYRRLALRVHPDKNPHPQAAEAFKRLSEAFDCLSEEDGQQDHLDWLTRNGGRRHSKKSRKQDPPRYRWKRRKNDSKRWWEHQRWEDIEKEILRQEKAWAADFQLDRERLAQSKAAKRKASQRREKKVKAGLAPLMAKYGFELDDNNNLVDEDRYTPRPRSVRDKEERVDDPLPPDAALGAGLSHNDMLRLLGVQPKGNLSEQSTSSSVEVQDVEESLETKYESAQRPSATTQPSTADNSAVGDEDENDDDRPTQHKMWERRAWRWWDDSQRKKRKGSNTKGNENGARVKRTKTRKRKRTTEEEARKAFQPYVSNRARLAQQSQGSEAHICWLCRRKFATADKLRFHKNNSELHLRNVAAANGAS